MTHNETNTSCPQNRCGEWSKCNNGECEGIHDCTCETPIESWEREFDETFILGDYNAGTTAKYKNIKSFIRTKLEEQRQRLIEEVREMVPGEREVKLAKDCGDCSLVPPVYCRHAQGWNDVREEMLSKLNNLK